MRTANAARTGMNKALSIAFSGGAVMGMCVVGLGVLGVGILYIIFEEMTIITGFGLGASSIALFGRVGGGIYTKAADVGADLVGKVEAGIPLSLIHIFRCSIFFSCWIFWNEGCYKGKCENCKCC